MMNNTFLTGGDYQQVSPAKPSSMSVGKGATAAPPKDERAARNSSDMTVFDTFSHGFDLPAGVQLSRINQKMSFWEKTQNHILERQASRELWAKNILKKQDKKGDKIVKAFAETARTRRDTWGRHNEARATRIANYNLGLKEEDKEIWLKVKQYYRDIE